MALAGSKVTVTTAATLIYQVAQRDGGGTTTVLVRNLSGGLQVDLGDSTVTAGGGFPLLGGERIAIDLKAGEALYGRVSSGSQDIYVLRVGVT